MLPRHKRSQPLHELQRRHHKVSRAVTPCGLELEDDLVGVGELRAFVGQSRSSDGSARFFHPLALVAAASYGPMQAEALMAGTQRQGEHDGAWHRPMYREYPLPSG